MKRLFLVSLFAIGAYGTALAAPTSGRVLAQCKESGVSFALRVHGEGYQLVVVDEGKTKVFDLDRKDRWPDPFRLIFMNEPKQLFFYGYTSQNWAILDTPEKKTQGTCTFF